MFDRVAIIFFCAIFTMVLGGCGGGDGGSDDGGNGSTSNQTASDSNLSDALDGAGHYITDVSVQNYGDSDSDGAVDITFGQVFAEGDVKAKQDVVVVADGKTLPTQVDRKASWSDDSLRHAVITVRLKAPAGGKARKLKLYAVARSADSGVATVSLSDLLGTNFSARVEIKLNGTTYTADARDALEQAAQRGKCPAWGEPACKRWLAGSLASEWIVPADLKNGNRNAPRLRVFFNIRAYRAAGGDVANVRVDSVIENDQTYDVSPSNETYDAVITVGSAKYTATDITHYRQARWHHVLWSGGRPGMFVKSSSAYLQESRAISKYADISPTSGLLDSVAQGAKPMAHVDQMTDMRATGAQAGIGPLPRWTSAFVVSGDRRAFNWMLANDDGAGSYGFHYRDDATGRPLTIADHPHVTIAAITYARTAGGDYQKDLLPSCSRACSSAYRFEIAHQPSVGYVPYLVTGDFYYLEEMQFEASYDELWANPRYREYDKGRLIVANPQVRGQAWTLRSIADAAFATPDRDPLKSYFTDQIDYIIHDYAKTYVANESAHPLHVIDRGDAVIYPLHGLTRVGIAPWQQDFFTWAVGHASEQGVPGAARLLKWMAEFQVELMTSSVDDSTGGFCWLKASGYKLQTRDAEGSPQYSSVAQVYKATYPRLFGLKCNSQEMVNAMSSSGHANQIGEMDGYPASPTGFPANLQVALAAAATSGIDKADEAWSIFASRSIKPNYSNYANFATVPR